MSEGFIQDFWACHTKKTKVKFKPPIGQGDEFHQIKEKIHE